MQGIVSLLDERHDAEVHAIWAELRRTFGLRGLDLIPLPHFSYVVARSFDAARLSPILRELAATTAPFQARTSGVGVFPGERPVVYLPVRRSPELSRLHERVWRAVAPLAQGGEAYYQPTLWTPHITLAQHDITDELLPDVIRFLNERDLEWTIAVRTLALIGHADAQAAPDDASPIALHCTLDG